jgi:hypothetical protein
VKVKLWFLQMANLVPYYLCNNWVFECRYRYVKSGGDQARSSTESLLCQHGRVRGVDPVLPTLLVPPPTLLLGVSALVKGFETVRPAFNTQHRRTLRRSKTRITSLLHVQRVLSTERPLWTQLSTDKNCRSDHMGGGLVASTTVLVLALCHPYSKKRLLLKICIIFVACCWASLSKRVLTVRTWARHSFFVRRMFPICNGQ